MIRPEQPGDTDAIRAVHLAAFPTSDEADLVDAMRVNGNLTVSLVAVDEAEVCGHIAFSPVRSEFEGPTGVGLAPVAVRPERQRSGVGSELIREGLRACVDREVEYVVVLGDPAYYRRFGFGTASLFGLANEYGVDSEFMVLELVPGSLPDSGGLVRYSSEFAALNAE